MWVVLWIYPSVIAPPKEQSSYISKTYKHQVLQSIICTSVAESKSKQREPFSLLPRRHCTVHSRAFVMEPHGAEVITGRPCCTLSSSSGHGQGRELKHPQSPRSCEGAGGSSSSALCGAMVVTRRDHLPNPHVCLVQTI